MSGKLSRVDCLLFGALLLIGATVTPALRGQAITMRIVVAQRFPWRLTLWSVRGNLIQAAVTNQGEKVDARFDAQLTRNGELVAETRVAEMPAISIPKGTSTFTSKQIFPVSALNLVGPIGTGINATGRIPPGAYSLSVRLCSLNGETGMCLFTGQKIVVPEPSQPLQLLLPADSVVIDLNSATVFAWSLLSPAPTEPARYRIRVFAMLHGQSAMQAATINRPVIEYEDTTIQFALRPQDKALLKSATSFAWQVTPFANTSNPAGGEDLAPSELRTFMVKE